MRTIRGFGSGSVRVFKRRSILLSAAWLLAATTASGADVLINGNFVAEDFQTGAAWRAIDDKYATAHQAPDLAPWSDAAPNYGAILRICQDATTVSGAWGGVWGAHIEQSVSLRAGHTYTLSFWAADLGPTAADPGCGLHGGASKSLQVQVYGASSGELLSAPVAVAACGSSCGSTHNYQFVAPANETAMLKFFFGGQWAKLKLAGVAMNEFAPAGAAQAVSLNQWGYLASGPKFATVQSAAAEPLAWELRGSGDAVLLSGTTLPRGPDSLSGNTTHAIDFSGYTALDSNLRMVVDGASSTSFSIADTVYAPLGRDALRFFYHQRCGQAIALPQAEEASLERSADHAGDASASCTAGQSCSVGYPLDVSRGWHDAGDYGKYVVNGGIAAWTLMNLHERSALWGTTQDSFADGRLNTGPENGVSDLLDEARYELEFLLGMQVPEGNPLAGMAHHKYHSADWVPMPTYPGADASQRWLHPPSTAATLNLAATAAQCARIWADLDAAFAQRCSAAAERAWAAALAHPDLYAPSDSNSGGGSYDDTDVSDELYWAAAELFITTGRSEYGEHVTGSTRFAGFKGLVGAGGPFAWPNTAGLGTLSLAIVPNALDSERVGQLRQAILAEAERYSTLAAQNGYGVPIDGVFWGSNSEVLNAGIVFALAHDLTGDARYLAGATGAMDYVLGRNPLDRSFVTRHGAGAVTKVHHTTFTPDLDPSFPSPPPGYLVGGPNAMLTPFPQPGVSTDCSPLRCWSETTGAYWFIEVAINWNAPLAWLAIWLDETGQNPRSIPVGSEGGGPNGGTGGNGGAIGSQPDPGEANGTAGSAGPAGIAGAGDDNTGGDAPSASSGQSSSNAGTARAGGCALGVSSRSTSSGTGLLLMLGLLALGRRRFANAPTRAKRTIAT